MGFSVYWSFQKQFHSGLEGKQVFSKLTTTQKSDKSNIWGAETFSFENAGQLGFIFLAFPK